MSLQHMLGPSASPLVGPHTISISVPHKCLPVSSANSLWQGKTKIKIKKGWTKPCLETPFRKPWQIPSVLCVLVAVSQLNLFRWTLLCVSHTRWLWDSLPPNCPHGWHPSAHLLPLALALAAPWTFVSSNPWNRLFFFFNLCPPLLALPYLLTPFKQTTI